MPGEAFDKALATDPQSAYGGVMCFNRKVDRPLAEKLNSMFVEIVFAPGFDEDAIEVLEEKPDVRLLENQERRRMPVTEHDVKRVRGGLLVQDRDTGLEQREEMNVVTERKPSEGEWGELLFAIRVCKHVRSNAIVLARGLGTVGIGAGQMSRVDSVRLAVEKARRERARSQRRGDGLGCVLPVPRRPPAGDRRRRPRVHPARRLAPRRRGDRRLQPGRRGDGLQRRAATSVTRRLISI